MLSSSRSAWWSVSGSSGSPGGCCPLAALLKLSMLFPDRAPNRFRLARGAVSTELLNERVAQARTRDAAAVAESVLELITALTAHDRRTRGHCERVRVFTELLADELRLPREARDKLRWAALLHDVGKLQVAPEILNKPAKLNDTEWKLVAQHPAHGEELLGPLIDWLGEWGTAVRQHHEKYDGTGYPDQLAGADIGRAARMIAITDSYEVMTAHRAYKKPMATVQRARRAGPLRRHPVRPGVRAGVPVDLAAPPAVGDGAGRARDEPAAAAACWPTRPTRACSRSRRARSWPAPPRSSSAARRRSRRSRRRAPRRRPTVSAPISSTHAASTPGTPGRGALDRWAGRPRPGPAAVDRRRRPATARSSTRPAAPPADPSDAVRLRCRRNRPPHRTRRAHPPASPASTPPVAPVAPSGPVAPVAPSTQASSQASSPTAAATTASSPSMAAPTLLSKPPSSGIVPTVTFTWAQVSGLSYEYQLDSGGWIGPRRDQHLQHGRARRQPHLQAAGPRRRDGRPDADDELHLHRAGQHLIPRRHRRRSVGHRPFNCRPSTADSSVHNQYMTDLQRAAGRAGGEVRRRAVRRRGHRRRRPGAALGQTAASSTPGARATPTTSGCSRAEYEHDKRLLQIELLKLQKWIKATGRPARHPVRGPRRRRQGRHDQALHRAPQPARRHGRRAGEADRLRSQRSGTSSATSPSCPPRGEIVLFDRSWYNRAGVERVMGFCTAEQYERVPAPGAGVRAACCSTTGSR